MYGRVVIPTLLALAACQAAETPEQMQARMAAEGEAFAAMLDSVGSRMARFTTEENPDSIAALYAPDARMFPQGEPMVQGREAIRAKYAEWFGMGSGEFTFNRLGVTVNGPIGVERGTFTMHIMPDSGAPPGMTEMRETGKYVIVWKLVDGQWLISDDIGNTDSMPGAPAPAASN
jgi:ketosteroid isomerase-like protein